jgi:hypothetical protein
MNRMSNPTALPARKGKNAEKGNGDLDGVDPSWSSCLVIDNGLLASS